jgi:hypothetical protein
MRDQITKSFRRVVAGTCILALALIPAVGFSQAPQVVPLPVPGDTGQPIPVQSVNQPLLAANQLDGLVAPLALYPDPLISQILVAATYPLEVVEANQWLQRNPGLTGPALTQAAAAQNWDPSVQALVMFPEVLKRLNEDVAWTTNLGNAFLNQQADVMGAIQRLRVSAQQSGRLVSTPQQQVINTTDAGQPVVQIVPTDPQVIYVPAYDPYWAWGPPLYYPYARWYYPPVRTGLFFGVGIGIGGFFGVGWGGWGGWGWHPGWGSRTVIVNNTFINRYHFNSRVAGLGATSVWAHDAYHRQGVAYPNSALSQRYGASSRAFAPSSRATASAAPRQSFASRSTVQSAPSRSTFAGSNASAARSYAPAARSYAPAARSYAPAAQSYAPAARSYAPQARSFAAPAPRSSAPMARSAAPSYHSGGSYASHGGGSVSHGGGRARR